MQVAQIMSRPVVVVNVTTTARDAARRMRAENIGALPVTPAGEGDRLVGMVTDRDITVRGVAENSHPSNTAVSEVMSEGAYTCYEDDSLDAAAQIMAEHQVRRLPVLDREERLVGIIALADIARSGRKEAEAQALEGISKPSDKPRR